MAISYLQNTNSLPAIDPQLILTDSLIGFVYEQIQAPDFTFGPYLKEALTTHNNVETIPESGGSYFNLATTQNNSETTPEPVGSYLNLAPTTNNNAETTPQSAGSCLNLAPTTHNNAETKLEPVSSCLNLTPTAHNSAETTQVSVGSYLNLVPATANNGETNPDSVGSYLNLMPTTHNNAETESDPVGSFLNLVPTTINNAEVGFIFNPVPTTYNNPAQVLTPNFFPIAPCISQHQDSNCTNAQNSSHAKAEFTPSQFVYHQACNNQVGTASLTNEVNIMYQNNGFPVMPCTGNEQGMMVPAFNPETGFPFMPCTGQMQGVMMMPAFKPASTQTVAARVRRKKISDKTQELARLIPGGSRMNTAEMLLTAFKYVNFLKAQIGILAMMDSKEAREGSIMVEEYMRELLGSTNVQEYLSANGMCLVPIELAMNLNKEMKPNNVVSRDLSGFIQSINNQDNSLS